MQVMARRKTAESEIVVEVDFGPRYENPKEGLLTTIPFFNHMMEQSFALGVFNLDVNVEI